MLEQGASSQEAQMAYPFPEESGSALQVSGAVITYDPTAEYGSRIQSVTIGGTALQAERLYTVAGNSYLVTDDTYPMLASASVAHEYGTCEEAIRDLLLQGEDAVVSAVEGRVWQVGFRPTGRAGACPILLKNSRHNRMSGRRFRRNRPLPPVTPPLPWREWLCWWSADWAWPFWSCCGNNAGNMEVANDSERTDVGGTALSGQ